MKIDVNKRKLEKLYDTNNFNELFRIFALCTSLPHAERFKNLLANNKINLSSEQTKRYVINEIIKVVRFYNKDEDYKNFKPYIEKSSFFKKEKNNLTEDEIKYLKKYKKDIKICKKNNKENISEEAYDEIKQLYEIDKEDYYTLIHRTNYFVDDIFEEGLKYGSSTNIFDSLSKFDNLDVILDEISRCENYKHSLGCFIIKVPKKAINEKSEPIYYIKEDSVYLNPKYVVAYVPVMKRKVLPIELNELRNHVKSTVYEGESVKLNRKDNRWAL